MYYILEAYQMQNIYADITSFYALNCHQQYIACFIATILAVDDFMPIGVL